MISATTIGNLGQDPELKFLQDGTPVLNMSIASNSGRGDAQVTTWVRAALFGKRAEALAKILVKGKQVAVTGSMSVREYKRQDGSAGFSLEQRVEELELLGKREDGPASSQQNGAAPQGGQQQQQQQQARSRARF